MVTALAAPRVNVPGIPTSGLVEHLEPTTKSLQGAKGVK